MKNALALLLLAPGCYVYSNDVDRVPPPDAPVVITNYAPIVSDGYAGVLYDGYYGDDVWTFEAVVDDPDGVLDVVGVWADVYDEYAGGVLVESFELFPTDDPYFWVSDWYGSTTFLDPFYAGYTVDIVAYDSYDDFDFITVWADTY
ncbi:MAG: hypothetical protein KTR31_24830 [Myxococcales bacterium]|nr:hypothetical protein [Myxococcales bacterium]